MQHWKIMIRVIQTPNKSSEVSVFVCVFVCVHKSISGRIFQKLLRAIVRRGGFIYLVYCLHFFLPDSFKSF